MGWSTSHELDAAMNITGIKIKDGPHSRNAHTHYLEEEESEN